MNKAWKFLLEMQTAQSQYETQATYLQAHKPTLKLPESYQYAWVIFEIDTDRKK